jgi:hypothetical protein
MQNGEMFKTWVDMDLDHLEEYAAKLEGFLYADRKEFESWSEQEAAKIPKEKQDELYGFYEDDYWKLSDIFPNILRLSFFVTCYSLLESRLLMLCKNLQAEKKRQIGPRDLRDEGIFAAKIYLKRVIGIDFPDQKRPWQEIVEYNRIRNIIVHEYGRVNLKNDNGQKVKSFVEKHSWIKLDNLNHIQLTENFYQEVIITLRDFFHELVATI